MFCWTSLNHHLPVRTGHPQGLFQITFLTFWGPESFQLKVLCENVQKMIFLTKSRAGPFWKDLPLGPLGVRLWWLHTIALLVSSYFGCL